MGEPSGREPSVAQSWDVLLEQLNELSVHTVQKNKDLTTRVAELEDDLQVWKQARAAALETAGRERKERDEEVAALKRRIAILEASQDQDSMILCILDGDGNIFTESLLSLGQEGGRLAAQLLTKGIAEYLIGEDLHPRGRFSFWVTLYFNRRGLQDTLVGHGICTEHEFESFLLGFSQASPRFLLVDVGHGKEAADVKIKECLQTYARFPQTMRIFFGGGHDNGYLPSLTALANEQLLEKLIVLKGYSELAAELSSLHLPTLSIDGLFRTHKLSNLPKRPRGLSIRRPSSNNATTSSGSESKSGPPSPNGTSQGSSRSIDTKLRSIDSPTETPPPCNEHYLMSCPRGMLCKYSHEYDLTAEQLLTLANNARKAPCNFMKHGQQCPFGDRCCWGHICPKGASCFHYSKGKCWFKGPDMHCGTPSSQMAQIPVIDDRISSWE